MAANESTLYCLSMALNKEGKREFLMAEVVSKNELPCVKLYRYDEAIKPIKEETIIKSNWVNFFFTPTPYEAGKYIVVNHDTGKFKEYAPTRQTIIKNFAKIAKIELDNPHSNLNGKEDAPLNGADMKLLTICLLAMETYMPYGATNLFFPLKQQHNMKKEFAAMKAAFKKPKELTTDQVRQMFNQLEKGGVEFINDAENNTTIDKIERGAKNLNSSVDRAIKAAGEKLAKGVERIKNAKDKVSKQDKVGNIATSITTSPKVASSINDQLKEDKSKK